MAILNKNRGDDDEEASDVAAGAPPADFEPNDPDVVKVHYNLVGWSFDQRAELSEALAEAGMPHAWDGEELLVPEDVEAATDALFERLESEIGPFPVSLDDEDQSTEFGLDEWPQADLDLLETSLVEAEIPHRWQGNTVIVAQDAEEVVDDLLDAIEAGEVASIDEEAEAPDGALHDLFKYADKLARDPIDGSARTGLFDLVPALSPKVPPFGITIGAWTRIVGAAESVIEVFHIDDYDPSDVIGAAQELRTMCRPYV